MLTEIPEVNYIRYMRYTTRVIYMMKICIFERLNKKNLFPKTRTYFHNETKDILGRKI